MTILVIQYIMVIASTQKAADERKKNFFIDRKKLVIYIISLRKCLFLIDIFDVKRKNVYFL